MNRLGAWLRNVLYAVCAVLLLTGIAWKLTSPGEARSWLMRIHGAAAMAALVAFGALLPAHVPAGWASRMNRASGIALLCAAAWLALSGLLLYYAGGESLRAFASQTHLWVGIALSAAIGLHIRRSPGAGVP